MVALAALADLPAAAAPKTVATIPPVHSLAASVMAGIGQPMLLVPGGRSPHDFALRPSDARALAEADVIIRVGAALETWLEGPLRALAGKATVVTLADAPGVTRLGLRPDPIWLTGDRHHGQSDEDGHDHGAWDGHLWLSPANAQAAATAIAAALARRDPAMAPRYRANAQALRQRIDTLDSALKAQLAPVRVLPYVVFHDAFQYFERHYALAPAGAITTGPERSPGAKRLAAIRAAIVGRGARCVFREPQFAPALARTVVAGTPARIGVLDPLGAALPPGPDLWFELMRRLASSLAHCLSGRP